MLLTGIPSLERPKTISALFLISSRPANSGGRVPAPGAYGFVIGFMRALYRKFSLIYTMCIIRLTLTSIQSHQLPTGNITWMLEEVVRRRHRSVAPVATSGFSRWLAARRLVGAVGLAIEVPGVRTME